MRTVILVLLVAAFGGCRSERRIEFQMFLVALGPTEVSGESIGCGDVLVGLKRTAPFKGSRLETALRTLLAAEGTAGLTNHVRGLELRSVSLRAGEAEVRLKAFPIAGVCDHPRIEMQLRRTAEQFDDAGTVAFFVGDQTLKSFLSLK